MTGLEIILLIVIIGFALVGFSAGLIQSVGTVVGVIVGAFIAGRSYEGAASFASPLFGGNDIVAVATSFILIFLLVTRIVGALFYMLNKAFKFFTIVPGLGLVNRIGGLALGLVEGLLFVGVALNLIQRLSIAEETMETLEASTLVHVLTTVTGWIMPLIPQLSEGATILTS